MMSEPREALRLLKQGGLRLGAEWEAAVAAFGPAMRRAVT